MLTPTLIIIAVVLAGALVVALDRLNKCSSELTASEECRAELRKEVAGVRRRRCDAELLKEIHDSEVRIKDIERIEELEEQLAVSSQEILSLRTRLTESDAFYTRANNTAVANEKLLANANDEIERLKLTCAKLTKPTFGFDDSDGDRPMQTVGQSYSFASNGVTGSFTSKPTVQRKETED